MDELFGVCSSFSWWYREAYVTDGGKAGMPERKLGRGGGCVVAEESWDLSPPSPREAGVKGEKMLIRATGESASRKYKGKEEAVWHFLR